ncbi:kynurenine 3-monooxygenase, mitochondrial precursor [Polyrhizophydium stewartii]|uniref:Kynurenine 3-monooxygenase n=1 Tax=Polyrhizophydium stewartii TaxID=2732419 RepID=A0ABR4NIS3_9FUNG
MSDFVVVVAGGGLVGSLSAVYFARRGYTVHVFEKRRDIRSEKHASGRSINLALSVRGLAGLAGAGVDQSIVETLIPMKGRMVHDTRGNLSSQPYGIFGECINSVDRKLVNEHLLTAAEKFPNLKLHFEHGIERCNFDAGEIVVSDANGTRRTVRADLIVGADGAFSRVRADLYRTVRGRFSQAFIDHGYVELTMPPTHSGEYAMDPTHLHIWPRQSFMMIALPNLDRSFTVTLFMPWAKFDAIKNERDLLEFFDKTFPDAVPLLGRTFLVQEYFKNTKGALATVKCSPYNYRDRVVIIGDAAHAMVPFYGQGMNCGFEDALVLDELFTKYFGPPAFDKPPAPGAKLDQPIERPTREKLQALLDEYSAKRNPDAEAICDLALNNYIEMRASVTHWSYLIRKNFEAVMHRIFPRLVIPLYTMVSFSRIPYSETLRRWKAQTWWYHTIIKTCVYGSVAAVGLRFALREPAVRRAITSSLA